MPLPLFATHYSPFASLSHPHRHQHVERLGVAILADQGRRTGVVEHEDGVLGPDLADDVEQVTGVETDLEAVRLELDRDLLAGRAVVGVGDGELELAAAEPLRTAGLLISASRR